MPSRAQFNSWTFTGQSGGARAGFSISPSAPISGNPVILIGAPGDINGAGAVYQLARADRNGHDQQLHPQYQQLRVSSR